MFMGLSDLLRFSMHLQSTNLVNKCIYVYIIIMLYQIACLKFITSLGNNLFATQEARIRLLAIFLSLPLKVE